MLFREAGFSPNGSIVMEQYLKDIEDPQEIEKAIRIWDCVQPSAFPVDEYGGHSMEDLRLALESHLRRITKL